MISWLQGFLGTYTPPTYTYYDTVNSVTQTVIPSGAAGVDWVYIAGLAVFLVVVISFFRCLGGLICKIF